jgi:hypothetical protein
MTPAALRSIRRPAPNLASSFHGHDRAEFEALSHIGALDKDGLRHSGSRLAMWCTSIQSATQVLQVVAFKPPRPRDPGRATGSDEFGGPIHPDHGPADIAVPNASPRAHHANSAFTRNTPGFMATPLCN